MSDAAHHPALQHHFTSLEQQAEASSLGMWIFLVTEIMFFGGMFVTYVVYRTLYPEAWAAASHELDVKLGGINTAILIGSSLTMALAVHAASLGRRRLIVLFLVLTILLGSAFLGIKVVEYAHKGLWLGDHFEVHHHLVPGPRYHFGGPWERETEVFFSLYFGMTGLHASHMVIGIGLLAWLAVLAHRGRFGPAYSSPVELTGLYWHFVDIVWIFLFPLLYLLGRH